MAILLLGVAGSEGAARLSFFLLLAAAWLLAWLLRGAAVRDAASRPTGAARLLRLLIPCIFGVWILIIWEAHHARRRRSVHPAAAAER